MQDAWKVLGPSIGKIDTTMRYTSSLPLVAAHLVVSGSYSCSAFVGSNRSAGPRKTRLCGKKWRYDSPLENHIRVDDDVPHDGDSSSGVRPRSSVNDGKPHGYRDDQAVMEMPNNVYIDGEFGGSAGNPKRRKSNELDPPEAYQILGLKDGCTDKAAIKKAYYDLVAKYHPDHNKWMDDEEQREAREKLYKINAAFTCIKSALQKRPKLRPGFGMPGMATGGGGNWYDGNRDNSSYFGY